MKRCDAMVDVGRRKFLTGASIVAGAAAANIAVTEAKAAVPSARVNDSKRTSSASHTYIACFGAVLSKSCSCCE